MTLEIAQIHSNRPKFITGMEKGQCTRATPPWAAGTMIFRHLVSYLTLLPGRWMVVDASRATTYGHLKLEALKSASRARHLGS